MVSCVILLASKRFLLLKKNENSSDSQQKICTRRTFDFFKVEDPNFCCHFHEIPFS